MKAEAGFYQRVYKLVREIPAGKVMSYGGVAAALGKPRAARQVGQALGALPTGSTVPWQRVVRSSGHIAFGGEPGRPELQRTMLILEGVELVQDQVNMAKDRWAPPARTEPV
jgi:methylated-DNA-protein-cysteine methyltransferase-like protein